MEVNPIAVIFVYMDSKGDRLLYRYPYAAAATIPTTAVVVDNGTLIGGIGGAGGSVTSMPSLPISEVVPIAPIKKRNPYAINTSDDLLQTAAPPLQTAAIKGSAAGGGGVGNGQLQGFADEMLSTLFAVKQQLCNQKFELKVNDVRFVSHPTLIQRKERSAGAGATNAAANTNQNQTTTASNANSGTQQQQSTAATATITTTGVPPTGGSNPSATTAASIGATPPKPLPQQMLINIVFALHAQASYSIVKCYYELSKRLSLALRVEEQRIGYLSDDTALMARTHDEFATQQQQHQQQQQLTPLSASQLTERTFDLITERSSLAQALKSIYHDLCTTGLLSTTLNANLTLSFCLPQKAHQLHKKGSLVDPATIDRCLRSLKPYHGMLLLVDFAELLDCVPPSGARLLLQLVEVYTPLMSLQSMASDADCSIEHVYKLVSHLVYWAKATIIYPLCETNVYVIAPDAPLHTRSHLVEKFAARFAGGMSLFEVIADFSLPTSIGHLTTPLQQPARQGILAQMVLWMLQHHLLMQLHTYVQFMPSDADELDDRAHNRDIDHDDDVEDDDDDDDDTGTTGGSETTDAAAATGGVGDSSSSLLDEAGCAVCDEGDSGDQELMLLARRSDDDDELNASASMLSMSSQPLPVPNTSRHSMIEDHYSVDGSTVSDNIVAQPSSSHKSNFSMTASMSTENCDSIASIEDEEKVKELLQVFDEPDRAAIRRIPASMNVDDLSLMVKLYQAGYFKSEHHLEEIMYFENLRRSQLLQLLDKFRDVLIIYETEDPAIASIYNNK